MLSTEKHIEYITKFLDAFSAHQNDKFAREAACLEVQYQYGLAPIAQEDLLAGRLYPLAVGFTLQQAGFGFFLDDTILSSLSSAIDEKLRNRLSWYRKQTTYEQFKAGIPESILAALPTDQFFSESGAAFYLCRMSGAQMDYDLLVKLGIPGLLARIETRKNKATPKTRLMLQAMERCLRLLANVCLYYAKEADKQKKPELAHALQQIAVHPPATFLEATQLLFLYSLLTGVYNYGRMDNALGGFLAADLRTKNLDHASALAITCSLWQLIAARKTTWDGRVVVGGRGRANETEADQFALLAMEASRRLHDTLPQLTLRFYKGQNPALMDYAMECIGEGAVYPLLYNDDVNIPAVERAFRVSHQEAENYTPFGCGEYILYHRSFGTPSGVINLLKVLELTLFGGMDHVSGKQNNNLGKGLLSFQTFEELLLNYQKNVEYFTEALAWVEAYEYQVAAREAGYLFLSILYDDCIERGLPIFDGGITYLGGTLETYGNVNTADALTAIREVVYQQKKISREALLKMLLVDFSGYEKEQKYLLDAPKYGNDNDTADQMLLQVHNHICQTTRSCAEKVGLHSYLVVVINNNANTCMGAFTLASADGRKNKTPMANANNPSGGSDRSGVTAFLNSLVKPPTDIHAGAVQNMKFTKSLFQKHPQKIRALLGAYFSNGGAQAMITVINRGDLEDALIHPEKHQNLIVRVGGFCARFVELDPGTQTDILSRTLY